jgi:hypothetical protein
MLSLKDNVKMWAESVLKYKKERKDLYDTILESGYDII